MKRVDFIMRKKIRRMYSGMPEDFIKSPYALLSLSVEEQENIIFKCCGITRKEYYNFHNKIKETSK